MAFSRFFLFLSLLLAVSVGRVHGQQFEDDVMGLDFPQLSEDCLEALNTTAAGCPGFLIRVSVDNRRLIPEELTALCTTTCRASLTTVRSTIAAECTLATDVMEFDGVVWPATYLVDRFLYTYDLACRKDSTSNEYCDEIFHDALASGTWPLPNWDCSDCNLGAMQLQLSSPFGYDAEFADDFTSTTSSCTEAGYAYTSPAAYAISANPAPAPETPTCQSPYVVQANDTCDSISLQLNVSTHAIIRAGSLNPQCSNLRVGSSLCLPGSCTLYQVAFDETCDTILAQHPGLDWISLRLWNPNINPLCNNIGRFAQSYICVSPPGAEPGQGTPITTQPPTPTYDPPTAVPMPPNGKAESIYPCSKWYTIQSGDYCERISLAQGIALLDFYYLNPSIDSGCTNLWLDTAYCVGAVGDINTYPAYPYSTSLPYSLTSATYTTTTQTTTSIAPSLTPVVPLPLAAGSQSDCAEYFEHMPVEPRLDQHQQPQVPVITESINSCGFVANLFDVTHDDLLAWNPSLASLDSCMLQPGFRYCALHNTSSGGPPPVPHDRCFQDPGSPEPGITHDPACNCYTLIEGREAGALLCSDLAELSNITLTQLTSWNTWVTTNCDEELFDGLDDGDTRAVCVGTGDGPGSSSSSVLPSSTTSSAPASSSTVVTPPAPTQPGIVSGCTQYHVAVDGDGCWAIANQYSIDLQDFYDWNPATTPDCAGLWLGYAYCVAI